MRKVYNESKENTDRMGRRVVYSRHWSRVRAINDTIPRLSYGMFNKRFPKMFSRCIDLILKRILKKNSFFIIRIIPRKFRYMLLMATHSLTFNSMSVEKLKQIDFHPKSKDLVEALFDQHRYFLQGCKPNFEEKLSLLNQKSFSEQNKRLKEMTGWAYWTLNHEDFMKFNDSVQQYLMTLPKVGKEEEVRYLPFHTSNLGHLTMFFLYLQHHSKYNRSRTLVIPRSTAANSFFLDKIVQQSSMNIEYEDLSVMLNQSPTLIDTLCYSLDSNLRYRTEIDGALSMKGNHQELVFPQEEAITLSDDEFNLGLEKLKSSFKKDISWFVTLHVREPRNRDLTHSQSRDVNIANYRELAEVIRKLGGEVIRMGDSSFPRLDRNFPAYDYAHSRLKSDFMDVWLWANSSLWIGNVNGATLAPIAFKKPRFITNQWYWNDVFTESDVILRKKIARYGNILTDEEIINMKISRCMDRTFIQHQGYSLIENSSDEIIKEFLSIYDNWQEY